MTFSTYLSLAFFTIFGITNGEPIREITGHVTGKVHDNTPDSGLPYYGYPAGNNAAVGAPERFPTSSGFGNAGHIGGTGQGNTRQIELPKPRYNPAGNNAAVGTFERYPTSSGHGTGQGNTRQSDLPQPRYNPPGNNAAVGTFERSPISSGHGNAGNTYTGTVQGNIRGSNLPQPHYNPAGNNAGGFPQGANTGGISGYPPLSGHGNGGFISSGEPIGDINGNVNGDVIDNGKSSNTVVISLNYGLIALTAYISVLPCIMFYQ
ncbi:hyphally regulated cell wall protein 3-like isoform X5 [Bradysia coprophila]|uniref:hyphally regulated cell wall protein 3-like isoform X5 n=1 Tax=Bradysia coprophila TaxID=38358 RepID=UPI00187DD392|nr:hyphally regulated cell wall protein 3-like isoform X5 [Bradysia coprophila]